MSMTCTVANVTLVTLLAQAQECENLMRVVKELTASRSKLVAGKSVMAERFAELQQEYIKVLRIAELSRAASRSNLAKADKATNLAKQVSVGSQRFCPWPPASTNFRGLPSWPRARRSPALRRIPGPALRHHCALRPDRKRNSLSHIT